MGLLDGMMGQSIDDPRTGAVAAAVQGLLSQRGMGGMSAGLLGYQDRMGESNRRAQFEEMQKMQIQQMQRALAQQAAQDKFRASIPSPQMQALQQAMQGGGGPTQSNATQMRPVDPMAQFMHGAMQSGELTPVQYMQAIRKDTAPVKLEAGAAMYAPDGRLLFQNPKEQQGGPLAQALQAAGIDPASPQGRQFAMQYLQKMSTHQPGTSVNVNTDNLGLKPKDRFDMEQKLTADYNGATENDRSLINTAADISNILKHGGALKDQAAIYTFAKALDPKGAVREADYAAIINTAGGLERVQGLFNRALTGEQLSPKQRAEMESVSRSMAGVAQKRIAANQKRFGANAKMYNLDPANIFQPQQQQDASAGGLSPEERAELATLRKQLGR